MNPLSWIAGGAATLLDAGAGLARVFVGDKSARDQGLHGESIASRAQFAAEFRAEGRTRFDSLIDGINRLPRPAVVAMVIYYFVLAAHDPIEFQVLNHALDTIPDFMWQIALVIVSFYFVAREIQKSREKRLSLGKAAFDEHMRRIRTLRGLASQDQAEMSEDAFDAAMRDTAHPLPNRAIVEWNRRRESAG